VSLDLFGLKVPRSFPLYAQIARCLELHARLPGELRAEIEAFMANGVAPLTPRARAFLSELARMAADQHWSAARG
jgi:hypothetical protein